jgi:hypothetical protein
VCWGVALLAELYRNTPSTGTFTAVSSGAWHACGLMANGSITCWSALPGMGPVPPGTYKSVSAGYRATCAVTTDGRAVCWRSAASGMGTGSGTPNSLIDNVPNETFASVSVGLVDACGVTTAGAIRCWGSFDKSPPSGEFLSVDVGNHRACGVRRDQKVECWGSAPAPAPSTSGPAVSIGRSTSQGDLDQAIIRRYIKRNIQKIQYCYESQLLAKPSLAGVVQAQFFISPSGVVTTSTASGIDPTVASCVANVIKGIEFPKPKGSGVQVNYPFTFQRM